MRKFLNPSSDGGGPAANGPGATREVRERISRSSGWFYGAGRTIYAGRTEFQEIELLETEEFGTTLLLDGATQVMEKNEFQYHEPMVHLALLAHPEPQRVLVIGGGDGGILREVLKHPSVNNVDFVELDREVAEFSRTHLSSLNGGAFDDRRVRTHFADGRSFVEDAAARGAASPGDTLRGVAPREGYDIVIMDMTDPAGPSLMLYTAEFFRSVKAILRDDLAFFVMHSESPEARPEAFARIRRTLDSVFPTVRGAYTYIRMYGTLWSFAICSQGADPTDVGADEAGLRLAERGIRGLKLVSAESWPAFFPRYPYVEALLEGDGPISTDADPAFPDSFDPR